jgi:hypothetical protein
LNYRRIPAKLIEITFYNTTLDRKTFTLITPGTKALLFRIENREDANTIRFTLDLRKNTSYIRILKKEEKSMKEKRGSMTLPTPLLIALSPLTLSTHLPSLFYAEL